MGRQGQADRRSAVNSWRGARLSLGTAILLAVLLACQEAPTLRSDDPGQAATTPADPDSATPAVPRGPVDRAAEPAAPASTPTEASPQRPDEPAEAEPLAPASPPAPPSKPKQRPVFARKSAIYDPASPAYALLQSAAEAMRSFPADPQGNIDWAEALRKGLIAPRASLKTQGQMPLRDDEVIMKNTRDMPWVRFPHRIHTEWLACSNCHPQPFKEEVGATEITMESIMRGQHCGQCHDRVAFSIFACERCHSVVHPDSPRAWW